MTTPEPLTYREIEEIAVGKHNVGGFLVALLPDTMDRLLYTARLGAKFVEMTKQDFIILKRADK